MDLPVLVSVWHTTPATQSILLDALRWRSIALGSLTLKNQATEMGRLWFHFDRDKWCDEELFGSQGKLAEHFWSGASPPIFIALYRLMHGSLGANLMDTLAVTPYEFDCVRSRIIEPDSRRYPKYSTEIHYHLSTCELAIKIISSLQERHPAKLDWHWSLVQLSSHRNFDDWGQQVDPELRICRRPASRRSQRDGKWLISLYLFLLSRTGGSKVYLGCMRAVEIRCIKYYYLLSTTRSSCGVG